ncbi:MAG TPA: 23S rRNA (adenine(2503)-C(2))-methyltransferase RlmN [Dehalococcoidales bacterium]|nr:23S rRNA (adenine(2503)-C(2))-methyltransferase RlmN [Dehalococcoidales bacterium]
MTEPLINLLDLDYAGLKAFLAGLGQKAYRADQLLHWIYARLAGSFEEMSDLPADLRQKLSGSARICTFGVLDEITTADGLTRKTLFRLADGQTIESTLMFYENTGSGRERRTVCVSTQAGCALGCLFCATGQQGFVRNLSPGEIIEQILYYARQIARQTAAGGPDIERKPITNVVLMGMGEPLANYDNVRKAVEMLNFKRGLQMGARQITLSTVGLVPMIERLTAEKWPVELAVSLHAPTDTLRDRLMPVNRTYPLSRLIPACRAYLEETGRRPTFEYALFQGINDSEEAARQLGSLLRGFNCSVNLIVGNTTAGCEFRSSTLFQAQAFQKHLFAAGVFNTIRVSRGTEIEAGCGQLRSRNLP